MTAVDCDVVVLGAGPAGEVVAGRCADAGLSVTVVERELVGGECSYWACIPSKTLLRPGQVLAAARRVPGAAAAVTGTIDVAAALRRRDELTSGWDDTGQVGWLEEHGVALVRGVGRVEGPRRVAVTGPDGSLTRLTAARAVVVATGSRAAFPDVEGLAGVEAWDNRGATAARAVPESLAVLGGGVVAVELAQAFARLGSRVTVLVRGSELLGREEPFAGEQVAAALVEDGVDLRFGVEVARASRSAPGGPGERVTLELAGGGEVRVAQVLVATGRRPATDDLGLDSVGVTPGRSGYLDVDEQLRVRGPAAEWLHAIGDVTGLALLTHMGKYQGRIVADAILGRPARDLASRDVVPRVVFTDPQVAAVGLTERAARERGLAVTVLRVGTGDVAGSSVSGEGIGGSSVLVVDDERRVLLGATFTGPDVAELLHSATVAIAGQVPLERLWHAVPSFPTVSEVWLRLLEGYGL